MWREKPWAQTKKPELGAGSPTTATSATSLPTATPKPLLLIPTCNNIIPIIHQYPDLLFTQRTTAAIYLALRPHLNDVVLSVDVVDNPDAELSINYAIGKNAYIFSIKYYFKRVKRLP